MAEGPESRRLFNEKEISSILLSAQSVEASTPMPEGSLLDPASIPDAPEEPTAQRERRLRT